MSADEIDPVVCPVSGKIKWEPERVRSTCITAIDVVQKIGFASSFTTMDSLALILLLCVASAACNSSLEDDEFATNLIQRVQRELMETFSKGKNRETRSIPGVVTPKQVFQDQVLGNSTQFVLTFEAFDTKFLLLGDKLFQVDADKTFTVKHVGTLPLHIVPERIIFGRVIQWRQILLLLVASERGYCRVFTSTAELQFTLRQTIHNLGHMQDAEFFLFNSDVYLALAMRNEAQQATVSSYIYHWTGTHLDVMEQFATSGAVAIRTFESHGAVIILVAQNLPTNPRVGSLVLRLNGHKLERLQYIATNGPLSLHTFSVNGQQFMLVINEKESSRTFWWSGKELFQWEDLPAIRGKYDVAVPKSQDFLYLLQNKTLMIYKPTETKFKAIQSFRVPDEDADEIWKLGLFSSAQNVLMYISRRGDVLTGYMLRIAFVEAVAGPKLQTSDPYSECVVKLNSLLDSREEQVNSIQQMSDELLVLNEAVTYTGKLSVQGTVQATNFTAGTVLVAATNEKLTASAAELVDAMDVLDKQLQTASETLHSVLHSEPFNSNIFVTGDLEIVNVNSTSFAAPVINGKQFQPEFWLTYNGDEIVKNDIRIQTLVTHDLDAEFVSGRNLSDLLLLNAKDQELTGTVTAVEVHAHSINLGMGQDHVSPRSFHDLKAITTANLTVETINGVNVLSDDDFEARDVTMRSNVTATELIVNKINGLHWDSFVNNFFLKGSQQSVEGGITFTHPEVTIANLTLIMANEVLCEHFLTTSTDQNIESNLNAHHVKAADVLTEIVNGDFVSEIAHVNVNNVTIAGPVEFESLKITGRLIADDDARIVLESNERQTQISVQNVTINRNLQARDIMFGNSSIHINHTPWYEFKYSELNDRYWTTNTEQVIPVDVELTQPIYVRDAIHVTRVCGRAIEDYVHVNNRAVRGHVEFRSRVHVQGSLSAEPHVTVADVDVRSLELLAVRKAGNYTVQGVKEFRGGLIINDFSCRDFNGVDAVSGIAKTIQPNHFIGRKQFDDLTVENNIVVDGSVNAKLLNNINTAKELKSIIYVNDSTKLHNIEFDHLKARSVSVNTINDVPLDSLKSRQNASKLEVRGLVEFSKGVMAFNVNLVNVDTYFAKLLDKYKGGQVKGSLTIHGSAQVKHLESNVVNTVDLLHLHDKALSKSKPQDLTGFITIDHASTENLEVSEISGVDVSSLAFTNDMSEPRRLNGNFKFHSVDFNRLKIVHLSGFNLTQALQSIQTLESNKFFNTVKINASLDWHNPASVQQHALSYIFNSSVTIRDAQNITGKVTFVSDVDARFVDSKLGINNLNLDFIFQDALLKDSELAQEVNSSKYFEAELTMADVEVVGKALIDVVNDIDILELNQSLVRDYEDERRVRGHKHFMNGFTAQQLFCSSINNVQPEDMATFNTSVILPATKFNSLDIVQDVSLKTINGLNLQKFMEERVSLKSEDPQIIEGNWHFKGNLRINGNVTLEQLNDVPLAKIMFARGVAPERSMSGRKHIRAPLLIKGALDADFIDGFDVANVYERALLEDENAVIEGSVVFANDVILTANLDVDHLVNGIKVKKLPQQIRLEAITNIEHIESYRKNIRDSLERSFLRVSSAAGGNMAREFMYLEEQNELQLQLDGVLQATVLQLDLSHGALLSALSWNHNNRCGLPVNCLCPSQDVALFAPNSSVSSRHLAGVQREFYFMDAKKPVLALKIVTNSVSSSRRCRVPPGKLGVDKEMTTLYWSKPDFQNVPSFDSIGAPRLSLSSGFLADVKWFKVGSFTYVVLAFFYDSSLDTHNLMSPVYRVPTRDVQVKHIQSLPTRGARVLDVLEPRQPLAGRGTPYIVHLVVGNTFDSERNSSDVNLDIYTFDTQREKFELLRSYPSNGIKTVRSMIMADGERLILAVQNYKAPLLVLRYDTNQQNFSFLQEIAFDSTVLDIGVFYVGDDGFFGAVTGSGRVQIYKYAYVEGFKLVSSHIRKRVRGFTPFHVAGKQYVFLPNYEFSRVLEIVTQGQ